MLTTSQTNVKLIDDAGQGAVVVFLRGAATVSKAAAALKVGFRVLSFATGSTPAAEAADAVAKTLEKSGLAEVAIIADREAATAAVALAVTRIDLVQSLALLAPEGSVGDASGLKVPALAVFGTNEPGRSADAPRNFCRSIPNCRLMYVYDAGRTVDDDRPEAVAAALQEFVTRREGFLVNAKHGKLYP